MLILLWDILITAGTLDHLNAVARLTKEEVHGSAPPIPQALCVKTPRAKDTFLSTFRLN